MRIFLFAILPLLTPFLVYAAYVFLVRRRQAVSADGTQVPPGTTPTSWMVVLLIGVCLSAASLVYMKLERSHSPDTKLLPPALVDGEVVPSRPAESAPTD